MITESKEEGKKSIFCRPSISGAAKDESVHEQKKKQRDQEIDYREGREEGGDLDSRKTNSWREEKNRERNGRR